MDIVILCVLFIAKLNFVYFIAFHSNSQRFRFIGDASTASLFLVASSPTVTVVLCSVVDSEYEGFRYHFECGGSHRMCVVSVSYY